MGENLKIFTIHKIRYKRPNRVGYENAFFRLLKVVKTGEYIYGVKLLSSIVYPIYEGKKIKFFNVVTLTILSILYNIFLPLLLIIKLTQCYYIGCRNFIEDSILADGVRFFNWVNIVIIFMLIGLLIFKCI